MTLQELKSRLSISEVLSHYGLQPDRNSMLCWPFHPDKSPSMKIYLETDTAYCFAGSCPTHGKSIDVIDFIMFMEKCSKAEAIRKAKQMTGEIREKVISTNTSKMDIKARTNLLTKLYQASLENHTEASKAYATSRKLTVEIGYCGQKLPVKWTEPEKAQLEQLGILKARESGQHAKSFAPAISQNTTAHEWLCFANKITRQFMQDPYEPH